MKKTFFILASAMLVLFSSCTKPSADPGQKEDDPGKKEEKVDIDVIFPDDLEEIELDYDHQDKTLKFEWDADSEDAEYEIVFGLGKDFMHTVTVSCGKALTKKLTHAELDKLLEDLGVNEWLEGEVYWYIKSGESKSEVRSMKILRFIKPFTDPRDGQVYRVCRVVDPLTGEFAIWLADNLRATQYTDGTDLTGLQVLFWEPNETFGEEWVDKFGGYYTWNAAIRDVEAVKNGSRVQGIAPDGWHIPSLAEWQFLLNNCTDNDTPGTDLKDKNLWNAGAEGVNSIGFNMAGAGYIWEGCANVIEAGSFTAFWAATVPVEGDVIPWNPSSKEFYHQGYSYSFTANDYGAALYVYDRDRNYNIRCVLDL